MKTMGLILGMILFLWSPGIEAKEIRFPEVTGWKQSGEVETFVSSTLYEYINGAADLYLMYEFEELKVIEYKNDRQASVTIDIYRHKTPLHAFGVYSQERYPGASFLDIGVQGYHEKGFLNFLTGPYYVKMSANNIEQEDKEVLMSFARKVADELGQKGSFPAILSFFPEEGKKKNSEKFIAKNFLGYAFFHSTFIVDYELQGKKFKLFVIEGKDQEECKGMIGKYLQTIKSQRKEVTEDRYILSDPHHGEVDLYWKGRNLWGIIEINDLALRSKYLKLFEEGLLKE